MSRPHHFDALPKDSRVSIRFSPEFNEYHVVVKGRETATYYTDNKRDAEESALTIHHLLTAPKGTVEASGEFDQNSAI